MKHEESETQMENNQPEAYDPEPDFTEEQWFDDNVRAAVENLQEILYEAGCGVNGLAITVPSTPGENQTFTTDFGQVNIVAKEIA